MDTIQMVAQIAGQTVPEAHVQLIASLIDGAVDTFKQDRRVHAGVGGPRCAMTSQGITIGIRS